MNRKSVVVGLFLCLFFILAIAPTTALAGDAGGIGGTGISDRPGGGIGGTGIDDGTGGGIGGTGIRPGGGIGGTGISDRPGSGIGGTGITGFGVIQAFGSIFVNGREYEFGPDTQVTVDGKPSTLESLRLGDVVLVHGVADPASRSGAALTIEVRHALVGRVETENTNGSLHTVLGQTITTAPNAHVVNASGKPIAASTIKAGDMVAVSALKRPDGTWVAERIERVNNTSSRFVLEGQVSAVDKSNGTLSIGATMASSANPAMLSGVEPGASVRVEGEYTAQGLTISAITSAIPDLGREGTRVEMQGFFAKAPSGGNGGPTLSTNGIVAIGQKLPQGMTGDAMLVIGTVEKPGVIRVDEIEPVTPPRPENGRSGENGDNTNSDTASDATDTSEQPEADTPNVEAPEVEAPDVEPPEVDPPEVEAPDIEPPEVDP